METTLQSYLSYNDDTPNWLGRIPAHWRLEPAWSVMSERKIKNEGLVEQNVLSLSYGRIIRRDMSGLKGLLPASFEGYQVLEPGNVVMRTTDMQNDRTSLRFGYVRERGIITSAYMALEAKGELLPEYMYRYLHALDTKKVFYGMGSGLRQSVDFSDLKRLPLPVPPPDEQEAITRYLNWFDGKVNRLIRAKQRLIALLNEQKQAIIQRTVTRGLDPDVPLKPSGVDWLGDVPAHWDLHTLWAIATPRKERNPGNLNLLSVFLDRGVIPYGEGGGQVHAPSLNLDNYQVVHPGDFVLNNQQAWRGSVGVSRHHGIISPAYIVLRMAGSCYPAYLNYLMRSQVMVAQFLVASRGVGDIQRQLYWPHLRNVRVPLPPKDEQEAIAAHLDAETREISAAISLAQSEIDLIREYRTRLVADVVTGKLDVRGVVVPELTGDGADAELEVGEYDDSTDEEVLTHADD